MLDIRFQETKLYQDVKQEGRQEGEAIGRQQEAASLVMRQLSRRLQQELSEELRSQITRFPLPVLEALGEALLDFSTLAELEAWLAANL